MIQYRIISETYFDDHGLISKKRYHIQKKGKFLWIFSMPWMYIKNNPSFKTYTEAKQHINDLLK